MENKEITKSNVEKVEKMLDEIQNMDDAELKDFINSIQIFHNYSFSNQIILMLSGASNVKGFQQWKKVGRSVKKGSKAIWILAPKTKKFVEENEKGEKVEGYAITGFMSVPVFDIKDTDGEPLPDVYLVKSDVTMSAMTAIANHFGFTVKYEAMDYMCGGCISGTEITLNNVHTEKENTGAVIHEIAHGLLGHTVDKLTSREQREQEAEILAYLIGQRIGVETKSKLYLKSWKTGKDILKSMNKIDAALKKFMDVYEAQNEAAA